VGGGGGRKVDVVLVEFDNSGGDVLGGEVIGIVGCVEESCEM
jgi:hypothetical protein